MFFKDKVCATVFVFISFFALSSWINVTSIWIELPLMVNILPEKWALPSYMSLVIQCSNIAPALYSIISKIRSTRSTGFSSQFMHKDVTLTLIIISVSIVASFLTSFLWDKTAFINGQERSIGLLSLLGVVSLASCTSSLVYLPYMARYPAAYLSAFYFGQGLSGLVPGLISLGQGLNASPGCINITVSNISTTDFVTINNLVPIYPEPTFSIQTFLLIISFVLVLSLISFYALNFTRLRNYQTVHKGPVSGNATDQPEIESIVSDNNTNSRNVEPETTKREIVGRREADVLSSESQDTSTERSSTGIGTATSSRVHKSQMCFYMISVVILGIAVNGIIPATQSYTCLPYSNTVYTLTVRLSSVIGSLSSLATLFFPIPGIKTIAFLMTTAVGILIFHLSVASMSPSPPLGNSFYGPVVIISTAILMTSFFSFSRVAIASKLHSRGGRRLLLWCGGLTQVGSFVGAMVAFSLINWFHFFKSTDPCMKNV